MHGLSAPPSTITHVALSGISGKGRIDWLKATFRCYVKMEGTKDCTHPFPQLTHCVMSRAHPSPPPLIFTFVKTSEKHRHSQALLAMSVFAFSGQDGLGKTRFAGFCQVRSHQKERRVTQFKAVYGSVPFGQAWTGLKGRTDVLSRIWRPEGVFSATKVLVRQG